MPTAAESPSPEEKPSTNLVPRPTAETDFTSIIKSKALEETAPWIDNAMQQALIYQKTIQDSFNIAIEASKSRFSEITTTSQAHFSQTIDSLQDVKSEIGVYEDKLFGKVKEGINVAASHPLITSVVAAGMGFVALKRPRRILYYKTLRLFTSEEVSIRLPTFCFPVSRTPMSVTRCNGFCYAASLAEGKCAYTRNYILKVTKMVTSHLDASDSILHITTCLHDVSHHCNATKWTFIASCTVFFQFPFDDGKCFFGDIITPVKDFFAVYKSDIVLIQSIHLLTTPTVQKHHANTLLSQADAKVKELRQSISLLKAESEKLFLVQNLVFIAIHGMEAPTLELYFTFNIKPAREELPPNRTPANPTSSGTYYERFMFVRTLILHPVHIRWTVQDEDGICFRSSMHSMTYNIVFQRRASLAEEEMIRGRTKLRQAGKQIQGVIRSAYKIERQATGLRDILRELPRAEASKFRSQVSSLASEAKQERNALSKEVAKISNHGISV
ncbi:hypothetical protein SADUNF_Sadunf02G0120200 [Salix dunnii]|uniref:Uncharacterized protein n=1 Tax=Salix dunnii TaxID=1413687 RepID=A0A835N7J1_9ROSI|nr:hypothetical protein SADUNF_Sadunf02G0120200 [Salix dunnii]